MTNPDTTEFEWVWFERLNQWLLFQKGKQVPVGANNPVALTCLAGKTIPNLPSKVRKTVN